MSFTLNEAVSYLNSQESFTIEQLFTLVEETTGRVDGNNVNTLFLLHSGYFHGDKLLGKTKCFF